MSDLKVLNGKKIALLAGGWSAEREVSLNSGSAVAKALDELELIYQFLDLQTEKDVERINSDIDLVFIALHGRGGEDGFIQEYLEDKGIKYTGSDPKACTKSMNKIEAKRIWRELLLPTPDFVEIRNAGEANMKLTPFLSGEDDITALDKTFVVKPAREGSSYGISIVKPNQGTLEEAMKVALEYDDTLIVEAFVAGKELTVSILGDQLLSPIYIKPSGSFYDYESKYLSNTTEYLRANLNKTELEDIKDYAWHAFSSLGCEGWGRVDFIQDVQGKFQIIEVNTVPGLTETSLFPKAAAYEGLSFKETILQILLLACIEA